MSKKDFQREKSFHAILEAAMDLFSEQGYDCTSIRQIAAKAGISLGLLYNYFSSKDEVLKAGILKAQKELAPAFEAPERLSPFQLLEHYVRATFKTLEEHKRFWRLYYSLRLQSAVFKTLEEEQKTERQKVLAFLTRNLAEAGSMSPSAEAKLMLATLDGIAYHALMTPDYPLPDVMIRYLLQLKNHLGS